MSEKNGRIKIYFIAFVLFLSFGKIADAKSYDDKSKGAVMYYPAESGSYYYQYVDGKYYPVAPYNYAYLVYPQGGSYVYYPPSDFGQYAQKNGSASSKKRETNRNIYPLFFDE